MNYKRIQYDVWHKTTGWFEAGHSFCLESEISATIQKDTQTLKNGLLSGAKDYKLKEIVTDTDFQQLTREDINNLPWEPAEEWQNAGTMVLEVMERYPDDPPEVRYSSLWKLPETEVYLLRYHEHPVCLLSAAAMTVVHPHAFRVYFKDLKLRILHKQLERDYPDDLPLDDHLGGIFLPELVKEIHEKAQ